ncbi:hypothetical protein [Photobacterium leiognathi]|uniref:hypothetical protein n=1 Tax=Photobacterium leiognathi TaxID=553611 RepID=UPI0029816B61|nr:hypothetical protein [Photobacterium leiognathi]
MNEIDYLLRINEEGVITFSGGYAQVSIVREWLDTPRGTVWGKPDWGNMLAQYKHLPIDIDTAASMQAHIARSLAYDLPQIQLDGIRILPMASDAYKIIFNINGEQFSGRITL